MMPELAQHIGKTITLTPLWKMSDTDPYPKEFWDAYEVSRQETMKPEYEDEPIGLLCFIQGWLAGVEAAASICDATGRGGLASDIRE